MAQSRSERQLAGIATPVVVELLRQGSESPKEPDKEEGKMPLFWRVFGGTVLSITALVVMTAYQSLSGNLNELRNEMTHLHNDMRKEMARLGEIQGELVGKDECVSRVQTVWRSIAELQDDRKELIQLKERCKSVQDQLKASIEQRNEIARELQRIKELHAVEQSRQVLREELVSLRERLAGLEARRKSERPAIFKND